MTITDDDLILYRYRDGLAPEDVQRIERAIADDPAVAARYSALTADLDRMRAIDGPAPAPALRRWRSALDQAARPAKARPFAMGMRLAAVAAVAVVAFGLAWLGHPDMDAVPAAAPSVSARMDRAVQLHLLGLEAQLAQASRAPAAERGAAIRRLVEQNRLMTTVAERTGAARDARVLRAFTVALEDLSSADASANGALKAALAQLDFEMKVTQARLASSSRTIGALPAAL